MARLEATSIRDAVIKKIQESEQYMDKIIYDNQIAQDIENDTFFVKSINPSKSTEFSNYGWSDNKIDVRYFLADNGMKEDTALTVLNDLMDILEYIEIDGMQVRGKDMETLTIDDVLHVFINYKVRIYKEKPTEEKMEQIINKIGVD